MGFALCWETWAGTVAIFFFFFGGCDVLGFSRIGLDWRWGHGRYFVKYDSFYRLHTLNVNVGLSVEYNSDFTRSCDYLE